MRSGQQVVLGHEFVGEVAGYGPGTRKKIAAGTPVVAVPLTRRGDEMHAIGLSAAAPGGYAEQVVVEESLMFALPNGLSPKLAVLTEPLAVGWHAVRRAEVKKGDVGDRDRLRPGRPRRHLHAQGAAASRTVVASDFSAGRRRAGDRLRRGHRGRPGRRVAVRGGADRGYLTSLPAAVGLGDRHDGEAAAAAGAVAARLAGRARRWAASRSTR